MGQGMSYKVSEVCTLCLYIYLFVCGARGRHTCVSCIYIQRSEGSPLQVPVVSFVVWVAEIKPQAGLHMPLSAKPSPGYSKYFLYASETSLIWSRLTLNLALQLRMILNCPASNHLARHCIHTIDSVTCSESVWEGLCEAPVNAVCLR